MDAPRTTVALYALGGTISMAGGDGGVVTRLTGSDIVAAVQGLPEHVEVRRVDHPCQHLVPGERAGERGQ
ncbi:MAG: hypothetical protein ACXVXC_13235, partial [Nocardioidaceae bacterium]